MSQGSEKLFEAINDKLLTKREDKTIDKHKTRPTATTKMTKNVKIYINIGFMAEKEFNIASNIAYIVISLWVHLAISLWVHYTF